MFPCHLKILAGETTWDFYMSFEDSLIVTLLSGTKGKKKKNCPNLWVSQKSEPLCWKNLGIKLLKSTVGLVELPQESEPTPCCSPRPGLSP